MHEISLLITNANDPEKLIADFSKALEKHGVSISSFESRQTKVSVIQYLSNNEVSAIFLPQTLDGAMLTRNDIEEIQMACRNNPVIIVIMSDSEKGRNFAKNLLELGIYNGLFEADADEQNLVQRIINPRSRKEALLYYGFADYSSPSSSQDASSTEAAAQYILSLGGDIDRISSTLESLTSKFSTDQMLDMLTHLPEDQIGLIGRLPNYRHLCELALSQKKKKSPDTSSSNKEKGLLKRKKLFSKNTEEEPEEDIPVATGRPTSQISFVSINKGVGCTYSAIMCAFALKNEGQKVAILELDDEYHHFESLCRLVKHTPDLRAVNSFRFGDVDFYFRTPLSVFESSFRSRYDTVIYDFGCCPTDIIGRYATTSKRVFVIGSAAEYRYAEISEFYQCVSPLDLQSNFVYLFTDYEFEGLGQISTIISKGGLDVIGSEPNPFVPSEETQKLFISYIADPTRRSKMPPVKSAEDILTRKRKLNPSFVSIGLSILLVLTALLFFFIVRMKDKKYDDLYANATGTVAQAQEIIKGKDKEIGELNDKLDSYTVTVCVLKEPVALGTKITEDMLTEKTIITDVPHETYLSKDDIVGKYAACNISADTPLYDYFTAERVTQPLPQPEEVTE